MAMAMVPSDIDVSIKDFQLWTDPFLSVSFGVKVTTAIVGIFALCFGTVSHCLVISFERFGGDPQKRSLINQLLSQASWHTIISYWMPMLLSSLWRVIIGPLNGKFFWLSAFTVVSYLLRLCFIFNELFWFKFVCIVICKRVVTINDDFVSMFLNLANSIVAAALAFVSIHTQVIYHDQMRYIGLPNELATYSPLDFDIHLNVTMVTVVVISCINIQIAWEARRSNNALVQTQETVNPRFMRHNKDIHTVVGLLAAFLSTFGAIFLGFWASYQEYDSDQKQMEQQIGATTGAAVTGYVISDMFHPIVAMIIYPSITIFKNRTEMRRHIGYWI